MGEGKWFWEFAPKKILGQTVSYIGGQAVGAMWDGIKPIQGVDSAHVGLALRLVSSASSKKKMSLWDNSTLFSLGLFHPFLLLKQTDPETGWSVPGSSNIPLMITLAGLIAVVEGAKS